MLYRRLPLILIPAILSMISCNIHKYKETESNNTFVTANIIETGRVYTGTIENEKDIDCYSLSIDRECIIRIEITGIKGVNHAFSVFKMNGDTGNLLKFVDDNRKSSPEEFTNLFASNGRYIISVHHGERDEKKGNPETSYNLKITASDLSAEEHEPNDKSRANTLQADNPLTGFYSPARDRYNEDTVNQFREEDWFCFDVISDENSPVTVSINLSGVSGVDSVLELYDSQFNILDRSDSGFHGGGESIIDYGIKKSGLYYAVAASKNFQFNSNSRYTISLLVNAHNEGTELEPNNNFDEANILNLNEIKGKNNSRQDVDYYSTGPVFSRKHVRIDLHNSESSDSTLAIYDSNRKKLLEINNTGSGGTETLPAFYIKETIYLAVTSNTNTDPDASYSVAVTEINSFNPVEVEPNNRKEDAEAIKDIVKGYTTTAGDIDYYIITNDFRKNYRIELRSPGNGAVKISTTDQSGYIIKTRELRNGETAAFNEIFEKKGYIIIETVVADFEHPYDLIVEENR